MLENRGVVRGEIAGVVLITLRIATNISMTRFENNDTATQEKRIENLLTSVGITC